MQVPGLFKIFDEIIVNAADNKQRDPSMTTIKVTIDCEANRISVWNDGKGIPVAIHSEHKCYVPELVFGHLLTGSNFDDDEKKTTGGRNGYGAKLTNIFSTEFTVETADSNGGKKLKQTWRDNMSKLAGKPVIQEHTSKKDYTSVSFTPDLARFKMERLDGDILSLLARRAYDVASCATCRTVGALAVYLNGTRVPVKSFEDYIALHDGLESPVAFEKSVDGRWAVGVASSEGAFQQLSFVNSICTTKGGTHVAHIADQVASRLAGVVKRKNKGQEVKPALIKSHLAIYVDSLIVNPAFDSQTKETLTTRAAQFGSKWEPSEKFFKLIEKSGIVDRIVAFSKFKQDEQLKRKGGSKRARLTGITKLDDANYAGGARARDCTLILTEGDSAKALAVSGLGVVGRDFYGVFPLKGKPLNVREASHAAIMKNEEIQHVVQIMGLKFGVDYDESNIKSLRYGHLMIMTDQDHDGSHIKGLLINCLHHFWPSLLKLKSFLRVFITPIVKATPRSANRGQPMTFFTLPEYEEWKATLGLTRAASAWTIKYYKGLGTSTAKEAKEYFSDINKHRIDFEPLGATNELAKDSDLIDMAFSKKRAEDRKSWLRAFEQGTYVNYSAALLSYSNFINRELVLFSLADNQRSIPCVIDGLKPSQRKVLFACFKRKLRREIKVAQLAGYVSEHAAYHHGEASLVGTIVGMAQDFVGSNNINLLTPSGQFGTRIMGGKDAASPRYIFTKLEPIARTVFHPDDDAVLDYLDDDGQSIEPKFYVPVLPLALCNGAEGIGTGWATSVPNYDPRAIIAELRHLIESVGDHLDHLDYAWDGDAGACSLEPAYRGFSGDIFPKQGGNSFGCSGRIERLDDVTVHIDELPVRKWTHDYKLWLEAQIVGSDKEPAWIRDFKENHTDTTVSFTVTVLDGALLDAAQNLLGGLKAKFKLTISIAATNMNFFDDAGSIVKYDTPAHILTAFYRIRFETYQKRKALLVSRMQESVRVLQNKVRFVLAVVQGKLVVHNRKRKDLLAELQSEGYYCMPKKKQPPRPAASESDEEDEASTGGADNDETAGVPADQADLATGFDYLLSQKIWALTMERVHALRNELADQEAGLADLVATPETVLWQRDLDAVV